MRIVKGVFKVVYKQSCRTCYTLTDPTTKTLWGELADDGMGAFRVETDMDGIRHEVLAVEMGGTLHVRPVGGTAAEIIPVPEVDFPICADLGLFVDDGILRG
ncbi:hypothetical protein UFOVP60_19 [uncultured Caudovirales phage]|uniref:Uncharacterized protein n=1 Tax=uncultured Caudovirales phage TaxID=2100421 RepID=A0A6J5TAV6_9CAUD|nr:hypothetical protein UFOVP60_19 [uncultured Caudovirales phage]